MRKMMLKMMFAGAAALALLMGGCMLFDEPGSEVEFDEFGRPMVTLSIFTGDEAPRNMSLDMAQALINYYEVVFNQGGGVFRSVSGPRGKVLTIRLAPQALANAGDAVVFGGYWNKKSDERTLLAVGKVNATNRVNYSNDTNMLAANLNVVAETKAIRFEMQAITTRFDNYTNSSFKFLATLPTNYGTLLNRLFDFEGTGGKVYPFFTLPAAVGTGTLPTFTSTLTFGGITGVEQGIWVMPLTATTAPAPPGGQIDVWSLLMDGDNSVVIMRAAATNPVLLTGGLFPTGGVINITLQPTQRPANRGWVMMVPNFEVRAISDQYDDGLSWSLNNGITFYEPHDNDSATVRTPGDTEPPGWDGYYTFSGADAGSSMGGGIMFLIGDPTQLTASSRAIKIIVVGPNT
jgi:hypothetical protein